MDPAPTYRLRDRDQVYGQVFTRRMRAIGIRDRPTSPRSPRQNAFAERPIGSIRRECVDHIVVFGSTFVTRCYRTLTITTKCDLSLGKDAPVPRVVHALGRILPRPILGGLHHEYARI
jgi:transposase InsO family protein